MNFDKILNWKLLSGSHEFPGPEGGTCINEAAIVAAGFEYKEVRAAADCPPCFSRVIAAYALRLNDSMRDELRQELLMPFVTRLAGTADAVAIEQQRAKYIAIETVRRILPIILRGRFPELAAQCEAVADINAAYAAADAAKAADADAAGAAAYAAAQAADEAANAADADTAGAAAAAAAYAADDAAHTAAYAAAYAADVNAADVNAADVNAAYAAVAAVWREAVAILDGAIRIGKSADAIDVALVKQRMDEIRRVAVAE